MKQILEMIESVDVNDSAKLDEIDARVWCWLYHPEIPWDKVRLSGRYNYCGSRDALKAIRPEGWQYCMEHSPAIGFQCTLHDKMGSPDNPPNIFKSPWYKAGSGGRTGLTEELAELHAILQAIAHERGE